MAYGTLDVAAVRAEAPPFKGGRLDVPLAKDLFCGEEHLHHQACPALHGAGVGVEEQQYDLFDRELDPAHLRQHVLVDLPERVEPAAARLRAAHATLSSLRT